MPGCTSRHQVLGMQIPDEATLSRWLTFCRKWDVAKIFGGRKRFDKLDYATEDQDNLFRAIHLGKVPRAPKTRQRLPVTKDGGLDREEKLYCW